MTGVPTLQIIVLAAGAATRFGAVKQLARVGDRPMLRVVLERAVALGGSHVSVVLGANAGEISPVIGQSPVTLILNADWREGLASSIRAGIARIPGSYGGAMLVLADQIHVSGADLQRLADTWRRAPRCIVAARYGGTLGAPVIFPRADFGALLELRGDRGAQSLLRRSPERVLAVEMPGAATDIDTPADLADVNAQPMRGQEP